MEPITAVSIATLAFTKAFEKTIEKITEATWNKIDALRKKIWHKLGGNQAAQKALTAAETGSQQDLELVAQYLEREMEWDKNFAQEVQTLAREIHQEINIGGIKGQNVQNVYGGEAQQNNANNTNAPVIQGGSGHNITFN
ncbi:hypothetical protein [Calothrix sp. CCY 0018]|uniref:hypothetical protein n=1 Tax=Calothrix sp. CCY 0018 TaxID=3103864 RepID=UPI0039C70338